MMLLCVCGGRNHARYDLFKEDIQTLSDQLSIEIRIAHYPPDTSKYHPIEHRLLPHITSACQGVMFKTVERVNESMAKAKTTTGLKVFTHIPTRTFETGRTVTDGFKSTMRIKFDEYLPQWNDVALPA